MPFHDPARRSVALGIFQIADSFVKSGGERLKTLLLFLSVLGCDGEPPQLGHVKVTQVTGVLGSGSAVREMRDDEHHVTCWIHGPSISCLRDEVK